MFVGPQQAHGKLESREPSQQSTQPAPPSISLPKGGGAIRGMGEKFAANPVTGTGSINIPIATSPGRSGFGPQLSLSYDSVATSTNLAVLRVLWGLLIEFRRTTLTRPVRKVLVTKPQAKDCCHPSWACKIGATSGLHRQIRACRKALFYGASRSCFKAA